MSIYTYNIPGLRGCCCRPKVQRAVENSPFAGRTYALDLVKKTLIFELEDDDSLNAYDPRKLQALLDDALNVEALTCKPPHAKLGALGLASGFLLLLLPVLIGTLPWPALALIALASTGLTGMLGFPFYRSAAYDFRDGNWTMDTLFSISTSVMLVTSFAGLFVPGMPVMFEAGLLIFGFRHTGIAIADTLRENLVGMKRLQDDMPKNVRRRKACGMDEEVALNLIKAGDVLVLSAGMMLPVDGMFLSGKGQISNERQTGDSTRNPLVCNQALDAGIKLESIQGAETVLFKASKAANNS